MTKKLAMISGWVFFGITMATPSAQAFTVSDILQGSGAFLTHLMIHESGHYVMAHMGGSQDVRLEMFKNQGGNFFVGLSSAEGIDPESVLPFRTAGVAASNHLFNVALSSYRAYPTTFNKALLFFSGTDFLWYSVWSFYIQGTDDPSHDPVGIAQETGLSPHAVAGIALLQAAVNAYRVSSGDDTVVPYLSLDRRWTKFGVQFRF